ncbi:hypothetical protein Syun_021063 [Stephania yunnanensis]|uniref:Uncharacterized protein n=1 Tax=Stephania yunnanensis TaxID=152371 RepID=A0AAP0NS00_9MAGN
MIPIQVTNIKSCIPIVLDYEGSQYNNWATLFKLHCRANLVIDHILPPASIAVSSTTTEAAEIAAKVLWERLDDIVRQWIYGTISNDLLNTIIDQEDTAAEAWNRLSHLFQDNKSARALALDAKFTNTKLVDFPNVKASCTRLEVLADNLANVGHKVSRRTSVLRLCVGYREEYKHFRTTVQHRTPLPSFEVVRSMLDLEEDSNGEDVIHESGSNAALISHNINPHNFPVNGQPNNYENTYNNRGNSHNRGKKYNRGRGGGNRNNNRGGAGNGQNSGGGNRTNHRNSLPAESQHQGAPAQPWFFPPWASWGPQPWATPPCPYPTTGWQQPRPTQSQQGILGTRPPQSFFSAAPPPQHGGYVPTDIDQAMHTMSLHPPDDKNWYMDTAATSHMTNSKGFTNGEQTHEM